MKKKRCVLMKKKRNVLIQRKIRSEEGASLSVALLFFLVCAIVGSVILAAATSSMGRMKNLSSTEQDKNAVYSTARLVVRRMSGKNLADNKILPKVLGLSAAESSGGGSSGGGSTGGGSTSGGGTGNGTSSGSGESGNTTAVFKSSAEEKNAQIVCNAAENTLTTTVQFSFYRTVKDDGTYVDSITSEAGEATAESGTSQPDTTSGTGTQPNTTSGSGTSQSGKASGSSTEQPGTTDKDYLNGQLPGSPFANLKNNLTTENLNFRLNLTGYESVRAGEIINSFWNNYVLKDDGKLGANVDSDPGFEEGNAYNWIGDAVPGNHTWMYGHTDAIDSYLNNNSLNKQSYVLSVGTDKDNEEIKVCVDFYMDKSLNIEAQIYPYKADKKSGKQTSTFKNASARCLVKIPANGGELQYTQDTDSTQNADSEGINSSVSGAVSAAEGGSGTSPAVSPQSEDPSDGSVTYKVTVTRSVTLSGFGWGNAKVYTGSAIAAQNPTERS